MIRESNSSCLPVVEWAGEATLAHRIHVLEIDIRGLPECSEGPFAQKPKSFYLCKSGVTLGSGNVSGLQAEGRF